MSNALGSHARRQKDKCVFLLYVDANSLSNSKGQNNAPSSGTVAASGGGVAMEFTVKELYAIEEIHSEANLLRLITGFVMSICISNRPTWHNIVYGAFVSIVRDQLVHLMDVQQSQSLRHSYSIHSLCSCCIVSSCCMYVRYCYLCLVCLLLSCYSVKLCTMAVLEMSY